MWEPIKVSFNCGQSYKHIYDRKLRLKGRNMGYFPVRYDS